MKKNELNILLVKLLFLFVVLVPALANGQVDVVEQINPHHIPSYKVKLISANVLFFTQIGGVQRELEVTWALSGKNKISEFCVRNSDKVLLKKYKVNYNSNGSVKRVNVDNGNYLYRSDYIYDEFGNLKYILKVFPVKGNAQTIDTLYRYEYDENTVLMREIGPDGIRTFDSIGRVEVFVANDGMQSMFWYNEGGKKKTVCKYDPMEYLVLTSEEFYNDNNLLVEKKETGSSTYGLHLIYRYLYNNEGVLNKVDCVQINHDGSERKISTVDYRYF